MPDNTEPVVLRGKVGQVTYRSEDTGYTVLALNTPQGERTAVGNMPLLQKGEEVTLTGSWAQHPKFGHQFAVTAVQRLLPTRAEGIVAFLASPLFPGVGYKTARLLVSVFGDQTLNVLRDEPERLTKVPGLRGKRATAIAQNYRSQMAAQETLVFLQSNGLSFGLAMRVFKRYGAASLNLIKQNPYRLTHEVSGIGFRTADALAQSLGTEADNPFRVRAGLWYALQLAESDGHTRLARRALTQKAAATLNVSPETVEREVDGMLVSHRLELTVSPTGEAWLSLPATYRMEHAAAARILALSQSAHTLPDNWQEVLYKALPELSDEQCDAVRTAAQNGVTVITGGPGTGKTTLVRALCALGEARNQKLVLCAPTGRAAKRLEAATGRRASTLHRLLEYAPLEGEDGLTPMVFGRNEEKPLSCDMMILDEASMVDLALFAHTLAALPQGAQLVLVGDADQLPPVGPGQVLEDLIQSSVVPILRLRTVFRQGADSLIIQNAHALLAGKPIRCNVKGGDCFLDHQTTPRAVAETVVSLCQTRLPKAFGVSLTQGTLQVLAPQKRGLAGVAALNTALQEALNPALPGEPALTLPGGGVLRPRDRVIQMHNAYHVPWENENPEEGAGLGVYNGDTGVVTAINTAARVCTVRMDDGRVVKYDESSLMDLELAYCLSVHKSQGSEYPAVVLALSDGYAGLLTQNLLYTAMTRAKQLCVFVGTSAQLNAMAGNRHVERRCTGFGETLVKLAIDPPSP